MRLVQIVGLAAVMAMAVGVGGVVQGQGVQGVGAVPKVRYAVEGRVVLERDEGVVVPLRLTFKNETGGEVMVPLWGRARYDDVYRFHIVGPDGKELTGPMPVRFTQVIPAMLIAARNETAPFRKVAPGETITCDISLGYQGAVNMQTWYFPAAGEYTLTAELVNTHDSYIDAEGKRVKVEGAFVGSVKSEPIKFTIAHSSAERGFVFNGGPGVTVVDAMDPGGENAQSLKGVVVDAGGGGGKPLAGAIVEVTAMRYSGRGGRGNGGDAGDGIIRKVIDRKKTGADGAFAFGGLPGGAENYELRVMHEGNFLTTVVKLTRADVAKNAPVQVAMKAAQEIVGKVVDGAGQPLAGVRVTVRGGEATRREVYTDDAGVFKTAGLLEGFMLARTPGTGVMQVNAEAAHAGDGSWVVVWKP